MPICMENVVSCGLSFSAYKEAKSPHLQAALKLLSKEAALSWITNGCCEAVSSYTANGCCETVSSYTANGCCEAVSSYTANGCCEAVSSYTANVCCETVSSYTANGCCEAVSSWTTNWCCEAVSSCTANGCCESCLELHSKRVLWSCLELHSKRVLWSCLELHSKRVLWSCLELHGKRVLWSCLELKGQFSAIANSVGSTDNRDQVMNALRTVPAHNDVINVHELRQIVKWLKNNKAVGNDGIPSEVYKFTSEQLLTMMSIFLSGCMLTGKLPNSFMHIVIIPLLKCKSKETADVNNYSQLQLPQLSPRYLSRSCCRDSPVTCGLQTANLVSSKHMGQK